MRRFQPGCPCCDKLPCDCSHPYCLGGKCNPAPCCLEVRIENIQPVTTCHNCDAINGTYRVSLQAGKWYGRRASASSPDTICPKCGGYGYDFIRVDLYDKTLTVTLSDSQYSVPSIAIKWETTFTERQKCFDWQDVELAHLTDIGLGEGTGSAQDGPIGGGHPYGCSGVGSRCYVTALENTEPCDTGVSPDGIPCLCYEFQDNLGSHYYDLTVSGVTNWGCIHCATVNTGGPQKVTARSNCLQCKVGNSWSAGGVTVPRYWCGAPISYSSSSSQDGFSCYYSAYLAVFRDAGVGSWYALVTYGILFTGDCQNGNYAEFISPPLSAGRLVPSDLDGVSLTFTQQTAKKSGHCAQNQCDFSGASISLHLYTPPAPMTVPTWPTWRQSPPAMTLPPPNGCSGCGSKNIR